MLHPINKGVKVQDGKTLNTLTLAKKIFDLRWAVAIEASKLLAAQNNGILFNLFIYVFNAFLFYIVIFYIVIIDQNYVIIVTIHIYIYTYIYVFTHIHIRMYILTA